MVKNFDSSVRVARKLIPKHKGPYVIDKVLRNDRYLIKDVEGFEDGTANLGSIASKTDGSNFDEKEIAHGKTSFEDDNGQVRAGCRQ